MGIMSAALGIPGALLGAFGVLFANTKREWLEGRLLTERMRQFHFQTLVGLMPDVLDASRSGDWAAFLAKRSMLLEKFKKDNFSSDEAYLHELASRGITDQQVREELLWQRRLLLFIDVRFRPAVQVSEQEIEDYFHKTVEPAAQAAHPGQPVTLEQYHDQIAEKLTGDEVDKQMTSWLASARQRSEVVVHPEAFQ